MPSFEPTSASVVTLLTSPLVLSAVWLTIWAALAAQVIGTVLGIPLALAERSRNRALRWGAWGYNWLFQGTPLLMQLIFVWAVLPQLGIKLPLIVAGLVGLGLHEAA